MTIVVWCACLWAGENTTQPVAPCRDHAAVAGYPAGHTEGGA